MKTVGIRMLQHRLAKILTWVESGEQVQVTKRNKTMARIIPEQAKVKKVVMPDFLKRMRERYPHKVIAESKANEILQEMRKEKF
ncbi:MAG: hypothetical protein V1746_06125 [bacterium]